MFLRFVLRVIEYPLLVALDKNGKTSIDELFSCSWGQGCTSFEFLLFASKPEGWVGHFLSPGYKEENVEKKV